MAVEIVDANWDLARQAATFKAKGKIACADCFAAALAKERKADLVTGDPEFGPLADEVIIFLDKVTAKADSNHENDSGMILNTQPVSSLISTQGSTLGVTNPGSRPLTGKATDPRVAYS